MIYNEGFDITLSRMNFFTFFYYEQGIYHIQR